MLLATKLERAFIRIENNTEIEMADPSVDLSPEAVLDFYANAYPVLTTARIEGPKITGDKVQYKFLPTIGTKG